MHSQGFSAQGNRQQWYVFYSHWRKSRSSQFKQQSETSPHDYLCNSRFLEVHSCFIVQFDCKTSAWMRMSFLWISIIKPKVFRKNIFLQCNHWNKSAANFNNFTGIQKVSKFYEPVFCYNFHKNSIALVGFNSLYGPVTLSGIQIFVNCLGLIIIIGYQQIDFSQNLCCL